MNYRWSLYLIVVAALGAPDAPTAQTLSLGKQVIGSGGNTATGGQFSLQSSSGQVLINRSAGGQWALSAGFWVPAASSGPTNLLFQDGFETPVSN